MIRPETREWQWDSQDANGNVLSDSLHSFTWDSAGRPVTIAYESGTSVPVTYDALGRAVEMGKTSGTYTKIVYGLRL